MTFCVKNLFIRRHPCTQMALIDSLREVRERKEAGETEQGTKEKKAAEAAIVPHLSQAAKPSIEIFNARYLCLRNICCVDADGQEFEHYDELYVRRGVDINRRNEPLTFSTYNAIAVCEQRKEFLPSLALHCNILAALYLAMKQETNQHKNFDLRCELDYYGRTGYGGYATNTIIDQPKQRIIHYPRDEDFGFHGGLDEVNKSIKRVALPFDDSTLQDADVTKRLSGLSSHSFVRNLTGLCDPNILEEIAAHFRLQPAIISVPTRAQPFGCKEQRAAILEIGHYFHLNTKQGCDSTSMVRSAKVRSASFL